MGILLTKNSGVIIGPISTVLGYIMTGIFTVLDKIGIPNIGLSIIIFTIVIYLCLMPLTIKQQKFSKLSAKMNPELQAIQKKYKDKKDQDSMMRMNEETKAVYRKYGVSPSGSCVQLLIQLPIMWALYRVIYNFPAYVPAIKSVFSSVVEQLATSENSAKATELLQKFTNANMYQKQFSNEAFTVGSEYMKNTFIDVLNKASSADWASLKSAFPAMESTITETVSNLERYNSFLGMNIANSPTYVIKDSFHTGHYGLLIGALLIPVLAALTQFISVKLMPQAAAQGGNEQADAMAASMKSMNMMMPLMSAFFCLTLPIGLGIYWIAGAVVRSVQQIAINRHIDTIDFDAMIAANEEKEKLRREAEKKKDKNRISASTVNSSAKYKAKSYASDLSESEREKLVEEAKSKTPKPGSMAEKVNMVKAYNEGHGIAVDEEDTAEETDSKDKKNQSRKKNK
ncbi:MAG: YidC/Oxa1 family membrane protein insertase [Lachnospiraceae bacterium]|nr:YidC/Oxa1 family membrane protein insertase [Lachnospiraceae bacterium]